MRWLEVLDVRARIESFAPEHQTKLGRSFLVGLVDISKLGNPLSAVPSEIVVSSLAETYYKLCGSMWEALYLFEYNSIPNSVS